MRAKASKASVAQGMLRRAEKLRSGLEEVRKVDRVAKLRFPTPAPCGKTPITASELSKSYGSLEMAVGVDETPEVAISLPLGAARLTKRFLKEDPYTDKSIRALRDHIEEKLEQTLPTLVKHQESDRAIATSKTLRTLARLTGDWFDGTGKNITAEAIRKLSAKLSEMDNGQRAKLPGVSENRASQIVAGAFVAESVMRNLDIAELEICPWALREGVVLKWLDWMEA